MKLRTIGACFALVVGAAALSGCVTTEKIATNQISDDSLTCDDIKAQNARLNDVAEQARHNKGVNSANVAAVLFFPLAAVGNYMDADHAEQLIDKRRTRLAELSHDKHCGAAT